MLILDRTKKIYRDGFKIARGAPEEFSLLLNDVSTLSSSIEILREEIENPDSILIRSGEDRVRTVNEMIVGVRDTLKALEKKAQKHHNTGLGSNSKRKQI